MLLRHLTVYTLLISLSTLLPSRVFSLAFTGKTFNRRTPLFMSSSDSSDNMRFGQFVIASNHIFYRSPLSAAFVNLRPIVPGHVLVVPRRVVVRLQDLTNDEYRDIWQSVRDIQSMLQNHYDATGFNVAVQDGRSAGQSVPHVHVHILPRVEGDFERNDDVYDEMEAWTPRDELKQSPPSLDVPEDKDRKDRTPEQMEEEAATYRKLME